MLYDRARLGSDASEVQRKIIHDDRKRKQAEFVTDAASNPQSIMSSMERFVKSVNEMNDTILLPTKLLDPEDESRRASSDVPVMLRGRGNNRYDFYHCLNTIKKDLVVGVTEEDEDSEDELSDTNKTPQYRANSLNCIPQQNFNAPARRHSTNCEPNQRSLIRDKLPTRKISLQMPSYTESNLYAATHQDNSGSAVNLARRQDSWASLNPLPEEQPSRRRSGWTATATIPEYHRQLTCDSGAECDESDPDPMSPVEIAEKLREHLQGLQIGFSHLTDTAKYITESIE